MSTSNNGVDYVNQHEKQPSLFFLYVALLFAMIMCGSAGVAFTILTTEFDVSPALCASWRLAWVEVLQVIPFYLTIRRLFLEDSVSLVVSEWRKSGTALQEQDATVLQDNSSAQMTWNSLLLRRYQQSIPILAISGVCLGIHFSAWVYSLRTTTLTHSLLWVSMGPMLLHSYEWTVWLVAVGSRRHHRDQSSVSPKRPTILETIGCILGLIGSIVLLGDVRNNTSHTGGNNPVPTWQGDFAALVGAAAVSIYLVLGRQLREWMPLWIYAFAVKGFAYVTCLILALFFDPTPITFWPSSKNASTSVLGCFVPPFLIYALYLGAGPGVGGHTLLNYLLKYLSPLTISTAMLSEPIIGSYLGYLVHLQGLPGLYTWTGGIIVLIGLFLILYGENGAQTAREGQSDIVDPTTSGTIERQLPSPPIETTPLLENN